MKNWKFSQHLSKWMSIPMCGANVYPFSMFHGDQVKGKHIVFAENMLLPRITITPPHIKSKYVKYIRTLRSAQWLQVFNSSAIACKSRVFFVDGVVDGHLMFYISRIMTVFPSFWKFCFPHCSCKCNHWIKRRKMMMVKIVGLKIR